MEYRAHYRRKRLNPFVPNYRNLEGSTYSIIADVPDGTPLEQVKDMAREAAKEGYEFVRVEPVEKRRR